MLTSKMKELEQSIEQIRELQVVRARACVRACSCVLVRARACVFVCVRACVLVRAHCTTEPGTFHRTAAPSTLH